MDLVAVGFNPQQADHISDMGGWTPLNVACAYGSSTTFTISSAESDRQNLVARLRVGTKVKLTQTTVKYFYVTAVTATQVTVIAGTDYSVTNAAISDVWFSNAACAIGFPDYFSWEPTYSANAGSYNATTIFAKFIITGRRLKHWVKAAGDVSGALDRELRYTLPMTAGSVADRAIGAGVNDNNALGVAQICYALLLSNNFTVAVRKYDSAVWADLGAETGVTIDMFGEVEI